METKALLKLTEVDAWTLVWDLGQVERGGGVPKADREIRGGVGRDFEVIFTSFPIDKGAAPRLMNCASDSS